MEKEINIQEQGVGTWTDDKKAFHWVYVEYFPNLQQYTIRDVYSGESDAACLFRAMDPSETI